VNGPVVEMVGGRPRPPLGSLVAGYAGYRITGAAPGTHRGLPSRNLTFIVTLDGRVDLAAMPDPRQPPASFTTLAGGLHARPALIHHDGNQHGIRLGLTPLGARVLFGLPAGELATMVLDLGSLWGPTAGALVERLRAARTWTDRFLELDDVLARVTSRDAGLRPELDWAWRRMTVSNGRVGVGTLAAEIGWSRRRLGERFRREFGLSPKVAGRVMRFEAAHRLLRARRRPGLADVAVRCGYYDQAHLHREWRELAGCTPAQWLAEEFPSDHDSESGAAHPRRHERITSTHNARAHHLAVPALRRCARRDSFPG
jgi:AraC-like DNA-binding protein